jgi:hypothetical protein
MVRLPADGAIADRVPLQLVHQTTFIWHKIKLQPAVLATFSACRARIAVRLSSGRTVSPTQHRRRGCERVRQPDQPFAPCPGRQEEIAIASATGSQMKMAVDRKNEEGKSAAATKSTSEWLDAVRSDPQNYRVDARHRAAPLDVHVAIHGVKSLPSHRGDNSDARTESADGSLCPHARCRDARSIIPESPSDDAP